MQSDQQPPALAITPPPLAPTRFKAIALLVAVFTFFLAAYIFTASADYFSTGDTTIRIEQAENILGRWGPDLNGWTLQYPHHLKKEYYDPRISLGRGGNTYSTYLLGQPLVIIPFDFLSSRLAVHERWPYGPTLLFFDRLVGPLFGALVALMFFVFAVRLGFGTRRSLLLTLILGFATSLWPDEQSVLEHTEVAFFLLVAFYGAYRYREQRAGWPMLLVAGIGIGGDAFTRYQDAFLGGLGLALFLLWPGGPWSGVWDRVKGLLVVGAGMLPFLVTDLWYNWVRFGSPMASGHHETVFGYAIWKGALGLTVSPGKGILWYCPVLFLLALAAPRFIRRFPALGIAIGFTAAIWILLYGYVTYWHGDPAWGPRYLYGMTPLLILPLGELLRWPARWRTLVWSITAVVVGISFITQFAAVSVSPWRTWYRVIAYEEHEGYQWQWIAARYRYHWNIYESPVIFQLHGLYQLAYDGLTHSDRYSLVPPDEDAVLDSLATTYAINQWNFWWKSNEFDWWMGEQKIVAGMTSLIAIMLASGAYLVADSLGVFSEPRTRRRLELVTEAA